MTVSTLQGDDYIVTTFHSDDMFSLMTSFQIGLRRRSKYAIAVQDASHFGNVLFDLVGFNKCIGRVHII